MAELNSTGTELEKHWFDKECQKQNTNQLGPKTGFGIVSEDVQRGVDWVDELKTSIRDRYKSIT